MRANGFPPRIRVARVALGPLGSPPMLLTRLVRAARPITPALLVLACALFGGHGSGSWSAGVSGAAAAPAHTAAPRAPAAARDGFRLEDAIALTSYSELTWSPDGRRLAFVADTPDTGA